MRKIIRNNIDFLVVDDTNNNSFWDLSNWESENYSLITKLSKNHSVFINAGGWIGPFTLYSSKIFDKVYSLEPDTVAFDELKRNVEVNSFNNVKIFNKAFDNKDGQLNIGSDYSNLGGSGSSIFQKQNSIVIDSTTLNTFFELEKIETNSFLMLDVEGSEYLLFDDFNFFKKFKPTILLSLHLTFLNDVHYEHLIKNLRNLLKLYNFDLESIIKSRDTQKYKSSFTELNILMEIKK